MGETGCGKTRLIKFMCALQQPPGVTLENMILMKVWFDISITNEFQISDLIDILKLHYLNFLILDFTKILEG
jgi:ABC-type glutathione transport system ATPase component